MVSPSKCVDHVQIQNQTLWDVLVDKYVTTNHKLHPPHSSPLTLRALIFYVYFMKLGQIVLQAPHFDDVQSTIVLGHLLFQISWLG
jgi:hypothetical protein